METLPPAVLSFTPYVTSEPRSPNKTHKLYKNRVPAYAKLRDAQLKKYINRQHIISHKDVEASQTRFAPFTHSWDTRTTEKQKGVDSKQTGQVARGKHPSGLFFVKVLCFRKQRA